MKTVEVVIRIPKDLYEDLIRNQQEWAWCAKVECNNLKIGKAVKNGTVLPKGYGDSVDRQELGLNGYEVAMRDIRLGRV